MHASSKAMEAEASPLAPPGELGEPGEPGEDAAAWAARVGNLWADQLGLLGLPPGGTVLEVGPGFSATGLCVWQSSRSWTMSSGTSMRWHPPTSC